MIVLALLLVQPVLDEPAPLRLVATADADVTWLIDGVEVATTQRGEAASWNASAGPHEVVASSPERGAWRILVRPDQPGIGGAAQVPAWTAEAPAREPETTDWSRLLPWGLAAGGLALAAPWDRLRANRRA